MLPLALLAAALAIGAGGTEPAVGAGLALFLAGLPHGAFAPDGVSLLRDARHGVRYAGVGIIAGTTVLLAPVMVLALFLLLSGWHFAADGAGQPWVRRLAIAGLAIGGSALLRPTETAAVFAALCGAPVPGVLVTVLAAAGAAAVLLALAALRRAPGDAALWAMLAAPALLHPVLATGVVFVLGHAGPVSARLLEKTPHPWRIVAAVGAASALVAAGLVVAVPQANVPLPFLAAAGVGLILPHLLPLRALRVPGAVPRRSVYRNQAATSSATWLAARLSASPIAAPSGGMPGTTASNRRVETAPPAVLRTASKRTTTEDVRAS
ncbi:hypothetical protein EYB45_10230 [Erythrobacteraceae bacterium CFH 75059]|nr:hypothetical protein EYB45_10230 [Erythrobacteraceae bacterium CFH 75059]